MKKKPAKVNTYIMYSSQVINVSLVEVIIKRSKYSSAYISIAIPHFSVKSITEREAIGIADSLGSAKVLQTP